MTTLAQSNTFAALARHKPTYLLIALIFAINLAWKPIMFWYDTHFPGAPWVVATVSIDGSLGSDGLPSIEYQARARFATKGVWAATLYTGGPDEPRRARTVYGDGTYVPGRALKAWDWTGFFEGHQGLQGVPPVPDGPYQVCVTYRLVALRSGVEWATPSNQRDCTDWQYPTED